LLGHGKGGDPLAPQIALIGLPGAGKSVVAPLLAERLGFAWVDLDDAIGRAAGRSAAALIRERGESAFRRVESRTLEATLSGAREGGERGLVIACGGGVVEREENRERLRRGVFVVWLIVDPVEAVERLGPEGGDRPLLEEGPPAALAERLQALLARRRGAYAAAASARVETGGKTPTQVAAEIGALWERAAWGSSAS
jgi:shikimate kinase